MVDVLILTHNEALNVPYALASVGELARQVFVVDSGSTDGTVALCQRAGATVIAHAWEGYAAQKNWALDNLPFTSPWILILDADEALTPELAVEIRKVVSRPPEQVREAAFFLNRVLIFMGGQIRHCGYFPSWNLRLFKRGQARYEERQVHEHMIVKGKVGSLRRLIRHEDHRGLEYYIAKHNRYSSLEARELYFHREPWPGFKRLITDRVVRRRFIKYRLATQVAATWLWRFFYMYFLAGGILDRKPGLNFCLFISSYDLQIRIKYQELLRTGGREQTGIEGLALPEGTLRQSRESGREPVGGEMRREKSPWTFRQKIGRVLWGMIQGSLFRGSPHNAYAWRSLLLRIFGAKLGRGVRIRRTVRTEIPWNLTAGDHSVIGDYAILYCLGPIKLGRFVTISQYAHLCAGTHETHTRRMALRRPPITIGDDVWVAADAFVGPGVTIGNRAILGARASAFTDLPPDMIAVGNPAKPVKARKFVTGSADAANTQGINDDPPSQLLQAVPES